MKIILNSNAVALTPSIIKNLTPTFTFLKGRRFSYSPLKGNGFKNISLNTLILAITQEGFKSEQDKNELNDFFEVFKAMNDKGYQAPICIINKENFLIRIVTKIKHFFSQRKRDNLLKELNQAVKKANSKNIISKHPNTPQKIQEPEENHVENQVNITAFPDDIIQSIFLHLDEKDIAAAAQVNKKFYNNSHKEILWKNKCEKEFPKWHNYDRRVPYNFEKLLAPFDNWKDHYCDLKKGGPVFVKEDPDKPAKRLKIVVMKNLFF